MYDQKAQTVLVQADQLFKIAQEELSTKPEDVWMDMDPVKEFIALATQTRKMVAAASQE